VKQNDFLRSPQAEQLLKDKEKVMGMMHSPDAQKLMSLLQQKGGAGLEGAAQAAMNGKPEELMRLMQHIMASPEGARAVENMSKKLQT